MRKLAIGLVASIIALGIASPATAGIRPQDPHCDPGPCVPHGLPYPHPTHTPTWEHPTFQCPDDTADTTFCVWDARHQGNGVGHSFYVTKGGELRQITHARAHRWLFG